jgi:hypothetical protein
VPLHELFEPDEIRFSFCVQALPHLLDALLLLPRLILFPDSFPLVQDALPSVHFLLNELSVLLSQPLLLLLQYLYSSSLVAGLEPEGVHDLRIQPLFIVDFEVASGLSSKVAFVLQLVKQLVLEP